MFRQLTNSIKSTTNKNPGNDVVLLYGARQVGKTTLLKNLFPQAIYINLETGNYLDVFNARIPEKIKTVFQREGNENKLVVLDEFQRLTDPGLVAKVIHDELPEYKLIITGSSSLELAYKASESLAGRKVSYTLFPLSFEELLTQKLSVFCSTAKDESSYVAASTAKDERQSEIGMPNKRADNTNTYQPELLEAMRYGLYPELLNRSDKETYLKDYVDSVMLKDVFYLNLVRNTKNLKALLTLLAYQVGNLVNITDLASRVGISRQTVVEYMEILKGIFIIYTLPPFRKNRRDEIGKTEKVYFYDMGVRNALINDFSPVEYRRDFGAIFENFVTNEILKQNAYLGLGYNLYHWRTKGGSEVDLILDKNGKQKAFEVKTRQGSISTAFKNTYPEAETKVITLDNFVSEVLRKPF